MLEDSLQLSLVEMIRAKKTGATVALACVIGLGSAGCEITNDPIPGLHGGGGTTQNNGGDGGTATSNGGGGNGANGGTGGTPIVYPPWETPPPDYCGLCSIGATSAAVANAGIVETSGMIQSAIHPNTFYVVNDSGDSARFFAVDDTGADLGEYTLQGASNDDYEDLALGSCGGGSCLFIGDFGDNDHIRQFAVVYRVAEPATVSAGTHTVLPTQFRYDYPVGPTNAETLLIHPLTDETVVISREDGTMVSSVFYIEELMTGIINPSLAGGSFNPSQGSTAVTGGDVHPDGYGVLIRTFTHVWYYASESPEEPLEITLSRAPCVMPSPVETQGEAIAWWRDGTGYSTLSEGINESLHHVDCTLP